MNEEEARKIDEKLNNGETITSEELLFKRQYDIKIFRQVIPVDDIYDFSYDVITYIKMHKNILDSMAENLSDEILLKIFAPFKDCFGFFNKIEDKAHSIPEQLLEFREKIAK